MGCVTASSRSMAGTRVNTQSSPMVSILTHRFPVKARVNICFSFGSTGVITNFVSLLNRVSIFIVISPRQGYWHHRVAPEHQSKIGTEVPYGLKVPGASGGDSA